MHILYIVVYVSGINLCNGVYINVVYCNLLSYYIGRYSNYIIGKVYLGNHVIYYAIQRIRVQGGLPVNSMM